MKVVLASKSPARLKTLQNAGVFPEVIVSDVDERGLVAQTETEQGRNLTPAEQALLLAKAKAEKVYGELATQASCPAQSSSCAQPQDLIVFGCDSVFEFQGKPYGRPPDAETAIARIQQMQGNSGTLHTGHWVVLSPSVEEARSGVSKPREAGAIGSSIVHFGHIDMEEIAAYVATGEPLNVAGSFTVDGLGGPYIDKIEGDYHNVVGISLPILRRLLGELECLGANCVPEWPFDYSDTQLCTLNKQIAPWVVP